MLKLQISATSGESIRLLSLNLVVLLLLLSYKLVVALLITKECYHVIERSSAIVGVLVEVLDTLAKFGFGTSGLLVYIQALCLHRGAEQ